VRISEKSPLSLPIIFENATMTQTAAQRRLFTVSDYYKMAEAGILSPDDRVELIRGEILKMSPIKSPHAGIINKLVKMLIRQLDDRATITSQNPLHINKFSEPEPDIIVARFREDEYIERHPRPEDVFLLIEVADSSLSFDRNVKTPLYAQAGIPEYWFVNLNDRQIEVFRSPTEGEYQEKQIVKHTETAVCSTIDFFVPADKLFL
jgi:Uma2 family endonuclease